jgi:hypothetical protein
VTASLKSHKLTVWKVGSSFSSIFTVGGLPRQGAGPGDPFKVIDFALDEESEWKQNSSLAPVVDCLFVFVQPQWIKRRACPLFPSPGRDPVQLVL